MTESRPIRLVAISLDCADPQRLADFTEGYSEAERRSCTST
jgi:hypothetical protein